MDTSLVPVGVRSGTVMTVHGPIPVERMGMTLMHEHILLDASKLWNCPCAASELAMSDKPVSMEDIGELRMNPFLSRDNCLLLDVDVAVGELGKYYELGGDTVVDPTNLGIGRDPAALQRIARRSRLNVVMGSGFYLEASHPDWFTRMDLDEATAFIVNDVGGGPTQPDVMAGIIGEVGVSKDFTTAERKSLRAAARASRITGVPLSIHLPGWERLAHDVLDIVECEGADLNHTVLCHMNPSGHDAGYQVALAKRGAFLEYDMIGMDYYYAAQNAQSPSDEENARAIRGLIDKGFGHRVLMSQDVFLKIMLTRYGGFGYGYILKHFVPRLKRHGLDRAAIDLMMKENPVRVFSAAT
ncbi:phosphotriesterase family protein [Lichenifustis flavocetrariae]|uniref:Phosphotriesterase-related protein n=1 Tax=Lichenifustis flavocetrariae TaxID=2949735 RepID=A0AA42CI65_9HYPH|nr:phosphotriesterase-related protein [Lichenifustis flavocetrariae]MCW6508268.1 phosphotriesterase-related protein [Lichenifustis flavocetrariae]